jgi:hypothetical protein
MGGTALGEQPLDDATVLHVPGQKAEAQPRGILPRRTRSPLERALRRSEKHVALAIQARCTHVLQRLVFQIREAGFELSRPKLEAKRMRDDGTTGIAAGIAPSRRSPIKPSRISARSWVSAS